MGHFKDAQKINSPTHWLLNINKTLDIIQYYQNVSMYQYLYIDMCVCVCVSVEIFLVTCANNGSNSSFLFPGNVT